MSVAADRGRAPHTPDPPGTRRHSLQGRLLVLAAAALWGSSATLARFVFHQRAVPPLVAVELRLVIALLVLIPVLAWRSPAQLRIRREDWPYFLVLGIFGVASVQASYYYSIAKLGVGLAILLQYLAPSLVVAYEALRGRRVGPLLLAAVIAATLGTALLVRAVGLRAVVARPLDWAVGLSSAVSFAFYLLHSKRGLSRYPPATVLTYSFLVAAILWGIVTPPWRIVAAGYSRELWLMFVALGLFSTLIPFTLFAFGLRRLPAAEAAILATFEPAVAVLSAWVFLGEGLALAQWLGATLVLAAAVLAALWETRSDQIAGT